MALDAGRGDSAIPVAVNTYCTAASQACTDANQGHPEDERQGDYAPGLEPRPETMSDVPAIVGPRERHQCCHEAGHSTTWRRYKFPRSFCQLPPL